MREIEEQAEKLMVQRVKEIREVYGMKASKEYVARMDRILYSLPEADKEWLDDQLLNRFCIVETEARELYLGGFRDAIHLLMSVGI